MTRRIASLIVFCAAFVVTPLAASASPLVWDLAADWSDTSNPNGVWSYNHGASPITTQQADWGYSFIQPAWALAPATAFGHIPVWHKAASAITLSTAGGVPEDMPQGRVGVHTSDTVSGPNGSVPANVTWTSPVDATVTISGGVWQSSFIIGRGNNWTIYVDGAPITGGTVLPGDGFNSGNPFDFANGSGGPGVLQTHVSVGDVIMFEAARTSTFGSFAGVDLQITVIPEPSAFTLSALGLVMALGYSWQRRKR